LIIPQKSSIFHLCTARPQPYPTGLLAPFFPPDWAQSAWKDLSSNIVDAIGTSYARALARDGSGNLYAAMTSAFINGTVTAG
jgi:hypothetical protein